MAIKIEQKLASFDNPKAFADGLRILNKQGYECVSFTLDEDKKYWGLFKKLIKTTEALPEIKLIDQNKEDAVDKFLGAN